MLRIVQASSARQTATGRSLAGVAAATIATVAAPHSSQVARAAVTPNQPRTSASSPVACQVAYTVVALAGSVRVWAAR
ncbi:hypothetical protein CAC01_30975 (plasmid) [Streptomyces sp. CLI2509]|nr:hypothetical protein CAC01_30975 [Streptomyces sp. CLI2509]